MNLRKEILSEHDVLIDIYKTRCEYIKKRKDFEKEITIYNNKILYITRKLLLPICKKVNFGIQVSITDIGVKIIIPIMKRYKKELRCNYWDITTVPIKMYQNKEELKKYIRHIEKSLRLANIHIKTLGMTPNLNYNQIIHSINTRTKYFI